MGKPLVERLPPWMKGTPAKVMGASLLVVGIFAGFNWSAQQGRDKKPEEISYTEFRKMIDDRKFTLVERKEDPTTKQITYQGRSADGKKTIIAYDFPDKDVATAIEKAGGEARTTKVEAPSQWLGLALMAIPGLLGLGILIWFMMSMNKAAKLGGAGVGGRLANMGDSPAQLLDPLKNKIRFKDVAGADEAKEDVKEIADFLANPEKYKKLGGHVPRGTLLVGPPGTGKTLLAKAIAGEAKVPFYYLSGSDFIEMLVGVGAARVRSMFDGLRKMGQPCILFIDEIDAIGGDRDAAGGSDERRQTLNAMLVEMDGFDTDNGIIVMAATNKPDSLDAALKRPGRFDRQVFVGLPDLAGRYAILNVHKKGKPLGATIDLMDIARGTAGFSGAELANLLNESALFAARRDAKAIHMVDVTKALDKIRMGPERPNLVVDPADLRATAEHEAGHAIVGYVYQKILNIKINQVTIIPRGQALGVTQSISDKDVTGYNQKQMECLISFLLGGRAAEIICHGQSGTGPGNDIERATKYAHDMVYKFAMGKGMPVRNLEPERNRIGNSATISEDLQRRADDAMNNILGERDDEAFKLIKQYRTEFDMMVEALMKHRTLVKEDIEVIMEKRDMALLEETISNRAEAIKQAVDTADADEAEVDDFPPPGVSKNDLWQRVPS